MPPTGHSQTPGQPLWALPTPDASSTTSCLSRSNRHSSTWAKSLRVAGIHCEADRSPSSLGISSCFLHLYAPKPQNCSPKEAGEVSAFGESPSPALTILGFHLHRWVPAPTQDPPSSASRSQEGAFTWCLIAFPAPRPFFLVTRALPAPKVLFINYINILNLTPNEVAGQMALSNPVC